MCIKCFAYSDLRQTPNLFSNGVKTGEEKDLQIFQQIKATRRGGVWVLRVLTSQHVSIEREKPSHRSTLPNILFLKSSINQQKGRAKVLAIKSCDLWHIEASWWAWNWVETVGKAFDKWQSGFTPPILFRVDTSEHETKLEPVRDWNLKSWKLNAGAWENTWKAQFPPEKHNLQSKSRHNQDNFKWRLFRHVPEVG